MKGFIITKYRIDIQKIKTLFEKVSIIKEISVVQEKEVKGVFFSEIKIVFECTRDSLVALSKLGIFQ